MEHHSPKTNNKTVSFSGKWIWLVVVMLSKINQMKKCRYSMFSLRQNKHDVEQQL